MIKKHEQWELVRTGSDEFHSVCFRARHAIMSEESLLSYFSMVKLMLTGIYIFSLFLL